MRRQRGFTVLELVVVLAILVILAGVLVGKLDILQMKANKGVAASNMSGVSRFVRTYRTARNVYPDNWDSLLVGTSLWAATSTTVGLEPQLTGTPVAGSPIKLATTTLSENATTHEVRSLSRMGITTLWNAPATYSGAPGNAFGSTGLSTPLADGVTVATLNCTTVSGAGADGDANAIVDEIFYPANVGGTSGTIPAGSKLVVVGLGPRNDLVRNGVEGSLLESAPFYSNLDQTKYYNRFLCVFEVKASGSRAKLVAVLGADGDRQAEEIADYYE